MKLLYIILGALALVIVWVLWVTGHPRRSDLLPPDEAAQLDALLDPLYTSGQPLPGNSIEIYTSLQSMYGRLLDDIAAARHHVHAQFFKFEDDATGRHVGQALSDRAAAGVEARLMYDDFVCRPWRPLYRDLRRQGVQTAGFRPIRLPVPFKDDYYRNHRKAVVIDGRVAYIGGLNIADRYLHGLSWGCWRDTMIRIEGPAATAVQRCFLADWRYSTGQLLASPAYFPRLSPVGALPVRIIASGPIGNGPAIMHFTAALLDRAERYVWFESPYFIPPDDIRHSLLAAARRGVDVRIILPPRGDRGETTQLASKSYFAEALAAGVSFALYRPGYMHSKIIVSDDRVGVVGSCNIDPRSYLLCEEVAAVVENRDYTLQLKDIFLADAAQSTPVDPLQWQHRPRRQKLQEQASRLIASQL